MIVNVSVSDCGDECDWECDWDCDCGWHCTCDREYEVV